MSGYIPSTPAEQQEMLAALGLSSHDELFLDIPDGVRIAGGLDLPDGLSEMEVAAHMAALAAENTPYRAILRGAGAYDHYIPAAVKSIPAKEEFLTAYTPYQAEMSQGVLQSIFEYQTMIAELTGMDVSNASVYDGATAAAEAVVMCRDRKRTVALVSAAAHPDTLAVIRTYCYGTGHEMRLIPEKDGRTDVDALRGMLGADIACVYAAQPSFFGQLEDIDAMTALAHESGAKMIVGANPLLLSILKTPGASGADICVGEAQPLGMPLGWGGPYLGFMAAKAALSRKLPGRIVGQTRDAQGRRAFVLTLQAREQHIRREKASSNICSNEALCALTAAVYMSVMGARGMAEAANQSMSKAHALADALTALSGVSLVFEGAYFNEFVTAFDGGDAARDKALAALEARGILGGLPLEGGRVLWCATEKTTLAVIEDTVAAVKEAL